MQAMKQLLALLTILLLAGCGGAGNWSQPPAPAQAAPSSLQGPGQPPPAGPNVSGVPVAPSVAAAPNGQPVKVAILVPLSGPRAEMGQAFYNAAQLALFDMGSHSFELMPRDTGSTAAGAEKATQSVIADGAQLILGPVFAPQVRVAAPIAGHAGINMISFSTDWTLAGGNTFIIGFVPFGQVQRIVEYAASQGIHRIGVLAPDDEYGKAVVNAYNAEIYRTGMTTVTVARFPAGQTDFTDILNKFVGHDQQSTNPAAPPPFDAVLIAVGGNQARNIANALINYGLGPDKVRRLGTGLWDDTGLAIEPGMQNALFAAPDPGLRQPFEKRYADTYGQPPPRLATLAYDATALAAVLARNGGPQPFDRSALMNPNGFAGLDGVFRFLPNGVAERGLGVLTFNGGRIDVQDPAPKTFQQWQGH
jgi:branched-chain amino acid transport system substrate-binding protein